MAVCCRLEGTGVHASQERTGARPGFIGNACRARVRSYEMARSVGTAV